MRYTSPRTLMLIVGLLALVGCAAQRHFDHGQAALIANDPINARHHFGRALDHNPKMAQKPDFVRDYHIARRDAAVVEGHKHLALQQPLKAIERFNAALDLQPGWAKAQEGLSLAHADAADAFHRNALEQADARNIAAARAALDQALSHVPDHPRAAAALASLSAAPPQHPSTYRQAVNARSGRDWDQALSLLQNTIAQSPDFLPARADLPATLDDAAQDMLNQGNAALAAADFDAAESFFTRIADYRPNHPERHTTLARVDLARGDAAIAQGLPGHAYLDFRHAEAHLKQANTSRDHTLRQSLHASRSAAVTQILNAQRLDIALLPPSPDDARKGSRLHRLIQRTHHRLSRKPSAALDVDTQPAPGREPLTLAIQSLDIPHPSVRTEHHTHPYIVEFQVPNPRIAHLDRRLDSLDQCLIDLRRRETSLDRKFHNLQRKHAHSPSCGCPHPVHDVHRQLDKLRGEIRKTHRDHQKLRAELRRTPHTVTRSRTEHWPYTIEHHTRTATLRATLSLPSVSPYTFTAKTTDGDRLILNPRPDLGLDADPLHLTDDQDIKQSLIEDAAQQLARQVVTTLTWRRVNTLDDTATQLDATDAAAALEARVSAALLLRAVSSSKSDQRLRELELNRTP